MLDPMAQGMFNAAVATDLHLAVETVDAHVTSISVAASQGGHEYRRVGCWMSMGTVGHVPAQRGDADHDR